MRGKRGREREREGERREVEREVVVDLKKVICSVYSLNKLIK